MFFIYTKVNLVQLPLSVITFSFCHQKGKNKFSKL